MAKFEAGMEAMLDTFVFETSSLLEELDDILMRTENDELLPDDIAEIFRVMHTIKGSSAMMGLQNMSKLAHSVEDLFYIIREDNSVQYDKPAMYELLFAASDSLKNEIDVIQDDSQELTDFTELMNKIRAFAAVMKGEDGAAAAGGKDEGGFDLASIFPEDEPEEVMTAKVTFFEECMMPTIRGLILVRNLGDIAEVCGTYPPDLNDDKSGAEILKNGLFIKFVTDSNEAVLDKLQNGIDVDKAELITRPAAGASSGAAPSGNIPDGVFADDEPEELLTVRVTFDEECMMPTIRALILVKSLGDIAEVCGTYPPDLNDDKSGDAIMKDGLFIKLVTDDINAVTEQLKKGLNVVSAESVTKPDKSAAPAAPTPQAAAPSQAAAPAAEQKPEAKKAAPAPKKPGGSGEKTSSIISVKLEKLDKLLDLVAEIVITESMVISSPDLKNVSTNLDRFQKSSRDLKKLTDELQDVVMSIRMVPVSNAFSKMTRVVRDMNKTLGKGVTLVFEGEETEVDKSIVDILNDPLMHIVRNAVDHGIETPDERKASGKTEPPTVTLSAGYDSGEVVISCRDNGAGMDRNKLLAKGRKNGILTKPESEYTDREAFSLIMAAGFSTNEVVTEYSGRGVGMDVVRKNIESVGGKLYVDSKLGEGSTFTIKIPLSLSIIDVMGIDVAGYNFSIPKNIIVELFRATPDMLMENDTLIMRRGMCLPLYRMSRIFGVPGENKPLTDGVILLCDADGRKACFFADRLIADQQVVVKPFSVLLSQYKLKEQGLSGCSVLGDGSITTILDMKEIIGNLEESEGR
ncbi:chemotaxis protein CheA [Ruminococcus sp. NK3A76]|uniref:chemotaxis protein CheA n=1 Tax=Ruminococcus sp. NK3A76 TaxID=877411 RepID=UPI00048F1331|nr:chemotaxis protein CheA [Ruminococcus sp. NK3A76]